MTTIAYHHEDAQIAVDGRGTVGNLIVCDEETKYYITDKYVFVLAGVLADIEILMENYPCLIEGGAECSGIVFHRHDGTVKMVSWAAEREYQSTLKYDFAVGSGAEFALAAMDMGADAAEAVAYAATRDNGTGGTIQVLDLVEFLIDE